MEDFKHTWREEGVWYGMRADGCMYKHHPAVCDQGKPVTGGPLGPRGLRHSPYISRTKFFYWKRAREKLQDAITHLWLNAAPQSVSTEPIQ